MQLQQQGLTTTRLCQQGLRGPPPEHLGGVLAAAGPTTAAAVLMWGQQPGCRQAPGQQLQVLLSPQLRMLPPLLLLLLPLLPLLQVPPNLLDRLLSAAKLLGAAAADSG